MKNQFSIQDVRTFEEMQSTLKEGQLLSSDQNKFLRDFILNLPPARIVIHEFVDEKSTNGDIDFKGWNIPASKETSSKWDDLIERALKEPIKFTLVVETSDVDSYQVTEGHLLLVTSPRTADYAKINFREFDIYFRANGNIDFMLSTFNQKDIKPFINQGLRSRIISFFVR